METADVIVIGSGQGRIPLAADFAKVGKNVVLFERDALGGSAIALIGWVLFLNPENQHIDLLSLER